MKLKKILRVFIVTILALIVLCVILYLVSWKSPKYYIVSNNFNPVADTIIAFKNYSTIADHPRPYILNGPNYTIFGAAHTRDPDNPEISQIEKEWQKLQPSIALIEGRLGFLIPGLMDPVKNLGEGGKVKYLAARDNVKLYNWDLSKQKLATQLLKKYNAEQVALFQILLPYFGELRHGKPPSPEKFVQTFIKRAAYVDQENNIKSVDDIDRLWKKYFPSGKDWREVDDQYGLPGFLEEIASSTNDLRNQQLVVAVKELTAKGEKVFLICGSSHAACVAVAFKDRGNVKY